MPATDTSFGCVGTNGTYIAVNPTEPRSDFSLSSEPIGYRVRIKAAILIG
jgi:hypothetical protein